MEIHEFSDDRRLAILRYFAQSNESPEESLLHDVVKARIKFIFENGKENFTFFWKSNSCFSHWYPSKFIGQGILWHEVKYLNGMPNENEFNCMEQYMMYHKAMLFLDREIAKEIMMTKDPKEQKRLGRKVANFDEKVWKQKRSAIVYWGNEKKFQQNEVCMSKLLETVGTTLVESSPYDKIWGIGLSKSDPRANDRDQWKGLNLLGEILTFLRMKFNNDVY